MNPELTEQLWLRLTEMNMTPFHPYATIIEDNLEDGNMVIVTRKSDGKLLLELR